MVNAVKTEAKQVGRFGIIGILNTGIAFVLFHAAIKVFSLPLSQAWKANLPAGAIAMVFSFVMNRIWVFRKQGTSAVKQAIQFFPVTAIGVFAIQTGLIKVFTAYVPQLGQLAFHILKPMHLTQLLPSALTEPNMIATVAFGIATLASLTWNYLMYKYVVFRK